MTAERAGVCAIAVMAKAPRVGRVKTRLSPPLTPEQTTALSGAFLRDVTENIRAAAEDVPIQGFIAYAPEGSQPLFHGLLADGTGFVLADGSGEMPPGVHGLGRCLLHAMRSLLELGYGAACLLNADSPTLPTAHLSEAARVLLSAGNRAVLGPAEDGGYYLIGAKVAHAHLFTDVAWSTNAVAAQTRERAQTVGLDLIELAPWYDVDDSAGLVRLITELAGVRGALPYYPQATAEMIQSFDLPRATAAE
jgi:rSAM/selenodomain-associated transferase 1